MQSDGRYINPAIVPIEGAVLFKLPSIVEKYANPLVAEWEYVSRPLVADGESIFEELL
jgi:hypothetical protein